MSFTTDDLSIVGTVFVILGIGITYYCVCIWESIHVPYSEKSRLLTSISDSGVPTLSLLESED